VAVSRLSFSKQGLHAAEEKKKGERFLNEGNARSGGLLGQERFW